MNTSTQSDTSYRAIRESEERLRFALDVSNQGIWDWNIKTGEIYFSPSWKKMLGFTETDIITSIEEWKTRIHPEDREQLARDIQTHFNSSYPVYENTYRLRGKDGNYRWIQGRGKIVERLPDGTPLRMIGTHTDISDKKESEEQYRNLFNITPLPTWVYDFETLQFLAVNEAAIAHYGYTRDEFLKMTICDIRPPDCKAALAEALPLRNPHTKATYNNWKHQKKNGDVIIVELNSTTISYNGRRSRLVVVNDITQKVTAEEELKQSNQRFQYVSKATSDAIYDLDFATGHLAWGEGLTTLFGYATHEVTLPKWEACLHPEEGHDVMRSFNETIYNSRKKLWKMEYRFLKQDGTYRYVVEKGFILRDEQHRPLRMIGALQDITELKQKQLELAESNKRYEYATLATSDMIWDLDLEKGIMLWSDNYEKVTGWKLEGNKCLSLEDCQSHIHPVDREQTKKSMLAALENTKQLVWEIEFRYVKSDGSFVHVYNRAYILRGEDGTPERMIGAMQNISQRKKLEEQLLQKELDKQKMISKATIDTQERERSEIGRELHDNVNQVLTTTKLYLELALSHATMKDELLQKSQQNIVYVINEIRQLSRSLMNPSLGDLGLIDSIQDLAENIQATGKLNIIFDALDCCVYDIPDNLELTIYRIIQEVLNNAVKHAQASTVYIVLYQDQHHITLEVQDDGIGFDLDTTKKGAGLKNIQNRVYLANGTVDIQTCPGSGCTLTMKFDLKNTLIQ